MVKCLYSATLDSRVVMVTHWPTCWFTLDSDIDSSSHMDLKATAWHVNNADSKSTVLILCGRAKVSRRIRRREGEARWRIKQFFCKTCIQGLFIPYSVTQNQVSCCNFRQIHHKKSTLAWDPMEASAVNLEYWSRTQLNTSNGGKPDHLQDICHLGIVSPTM